MSVTLKKIPDEPIFIVTVKGTLTAEMVKELYTELGEQTKDMPLPIYRITDVRQLETTFMEVMAVIKEASQKYPGTTSDPRIIHIFVGKDKFAKIARDVMRRINPNNHPMMDSIDEALEYIHWQMAREE